MLSKAGKHYGENIIKKYSIKLIKEVNKKYNTTNLKRMRQFYWIIEKGAPMAHQLSWSHYVELLPIKNINELLYYLNISIEQSLSRNMLRCRIKSKEYERLPEDTRCKLVKKEETKIEDFIKNPIVIKNNYNNEDINEKLLQKIILENIESFMKELGNGYTFVGSEYKIKLDNTYSRTLSREYKLI